MESTHSARRAWRLSKRNTRARWRKWRRQIDTDEDLGRCLSAPTTDRLFSTANQFNRKATGESVQAGISMIFQDTSLFENLTVAENLLFDRLPRSYLGTLSYRKLFCAGEVVVAQAGV